MNSIVIRILFWFGCLIPFALPALSAELPSAGQGIPCTIDSVVITNPVCNNQCNGTIQVFAQGSGPLFYQWPGIPGADSSFISGLCAGNYIVIVTDSSGCVSTDSITVTQPFPIGFTLSVLDATCPGGCSGSITVTSLDTFPYTFQWPGYMETGPVLGNLCQGTYSVIITDSQGCSVSGSAQVGYNAPFSLSFVSTPSTCLSACDGSATVTANGIPPFTYQWGTGPIQNTQGAINLCAGIYHVDVSDSTGCVVTDSVNVALLPAPMVSVSVVPPTCFGGCDGQATAVVSGTGNYHYEWNTFPPQDSSSAIGLCPGIYFVEITDLLSGCLFVDSAEVINPPAPQLSFVSAPSFCDNICTGAATVFANGPGPYTYLWQSGNTAQSDTALCPGIYSVTLTDSSGCSTSASVTVPSQELLFVIDDANCNTVCDGTAEVLLPAGSLWQVTWFTAPVQNTAQAISLCSGNYTVTIQDTSGCIITASTTVDEQQPIDVLYNVTNATCPGGCDGAVVVNVTGNGPFLFDWSSIPGQTSDSVTQLCAGLYPLTITDSVGCSLTDSILVSEPAVPQFTYSITPNSCFSVCDASAVISPVITGAYTYEWQTTPLQYGTAATGLCIDYTIVSITDSIGCVFTDSVLIIGPDPIFVGVSSVSPSCPGVCDGFVSCLALGGTPGYSYFWSSGFATPQVIDVCEGTYTVTVTDASGCTESNTVTVTDPDSIAISFSVTDASCFTCADGTITAMVTGGSPGYNYFWTPGGIGGPFIDSLVTGTYTLCVADANLCVLCEEAFVSFFNGVQDNISSSSEMMIYPNPFSGRTSVTFTDNEMTTPGSFSIEILDILGRKMNQFSVVVNVSNQSGASISLFSNDAPDGVYFIKIISENKKIITRKLMVQH